MITNLYPRLDPKCVYTLDQVSFRSTSGSCLAFGKLALVFPTEALRINGGAYDLHSRDNAAGMFKILSDSQLAIKVLNACNAMSSMPAERRFQIQTRGHKKQQLMAVTEQIADK